jgi:hypothetical protein
MGLLLLSTSTVDCSLEKEDYIHGPQCRDLLDILLVETVLVNAGL